MSILSRTLDTLISTSPIPVWMVAVACHTAWRPSGREIELTVEHEAGVAPRLDHLPEERSNSEGITSVDV